ncbi:acid protease [Aureobasidium pullulans]|nr:acid protease [Aureobasidium pullulans]
MKKSGFVTLFLSALSLLAEATGSVKYELQKLGAGLAQGGSIEAALTSRFAKNFGQAYYLNVSVGTPGQLQTVMIDTGARDFIVTASSAPACEVRICAGGTFNSTESSTLHTVARDGLDVTYGDWSTRSGDYITDVVRIGDVSITGTRLGLAYDTHDSSGVEFGIMGLGYPRNEADNEAIENTGRLYPTFVEALVHNNAIASRLYSIHLNRLDQPGSMIFGGIDLDGFEGPLTTLNCLPNHGTVDDFWLSLEEITLKSHNGSTQSLMRSAGHKSYPVLLDSGTEYWGLPSVPYAKIVESIGGFVWNEPALWLQRPCNDLFHAGVDQPYLQLTFSGHGPNNATLDLKLNDLLVPILAEDGSMKTDKDGEPLCRLIIRDYEEPDQDGMMMPGAVMRAGYFVFDLDNGQISMAQANFAANSSNVVHVEAGTDGLKKAFHGLIPETQTSHVAGQPGH